MPVIETDRLTKTFSSLTAVDQLSFEVGEGEVFGLLGPNGAGKTTTIRMLAALISPSGGEARVLGFDVEDDAQAVRESVGILTENPGHYEKLTAYENMEFFAQAYDVSDGRDERIRELLDFFDLWDRRGDKVGTFSRGMKQKLSIARAIVHDPSVLFLDEPTSGLDPQTSKGIRDLIQTLSRHENRTILLSTHRLEDAERLSHAVMIVERGNKIAIGTLQELQRQISKPSTLTITLSELGQEVRTALSEMAQLTEVEFDSNSVLIQADDAQKIAPEAVRKVVEAGGDVLEVRVHAPTLEEAYLELTRR